MRTLFYVIQIHFSHRGAIKSRRDATWWWGMINNYAHWRTMRHWIMSIFLLKKETKVAFYMTNWKEKSTWKILRGTFILSWYKSWGIHCMGSSKAPGHGIPSTTLPYCQRGSKDASLVAKEITFLLLSIIQLEEGGEVHMYCNWKLVHTRTITLHYCSTEMHIAEIFS